MPRAPLSESQLHSLSELNLALSGEDAFSRRFGGGEPGQCLEDFLRHACSSVPFYRDKLKISQNAANLSCYPLISRDVISAQPTAFLSDDAKVITGKTSGTSGSPLSVQWDEAGWFDANVGVYRHLRPYFNAAGLHFSPGETGVAAVTTKPNRDPITLWLPTLDFSLFERWPIQLDKRNSRSLISSMRAAEIPVLHGKPHCLRTLADLDRQVGGGAIRPGILLTSGECVHTDDVTALESWFGCSLIDALVSTESGLIASRLGKSAAMHIYTENKFIEVLGVDGNVHTDGYGELIVTNPSNWAMAFIRYRTGDFGTIIRSSDAAHLILEARESHTIQLGSKSVPTEVFNHFFYSFGIWDFRIEIVNEGITCIWAPSFDSPPKAVVTEAIHTLFNHLAPEVSFRTSSVLAVTPAGGKRIRYPRKSHSGQSQHLNSPLPASKK